MTALLRQSSFAIAEQFSQPIVLLIATSALLQNLGGEQFGLFTITLTLTAMSSVLGLGMSTLIVREVAYQFQNSKLNIVTNYLRIALTVVLAVSLLVIVVIVVYFTFPVWFTNRQDVNQLYFISAVIVGLSSAATQEIDMIYTGAMKGLSRFGLSAVIEIGGRFVWLIAVLLGAYIEGLEGALLASLLILLTKAFIKGLICAHLLGSLLIFLPSFDIHLIRYLLHRSLWLWVQGVGAIMLFTVDRLIVGNIFGASIMGSYVACAQLAVVGLQVPASAGQALVPWFLRHRANKTNPVLGWKFTLSCMAVVCAVPGLLIAIFSYVGLMLWLGPNFANTYWAVLAALALGSATVAAVVPFHYCLLAAGASRIIALVNIGGGLASILLCIIVAKYGLIAFSLGKLIFAIPIAVLPYLLFRYLTHQTKLV